MVFRIYNPMETSNQVRFATQIFNNPSFRCRTGDTVKIIVTSGFILLTRAMIADKLSVIASTESNSFRKCLFGTQAIRNNPIRFDMPVNPGSS